MHNNIKAMNIEYDKFDINNTTNIDEFLKELDGTDEKLSFTEIYFLMDRELQYYGHTPEDRLRKVGIIDKYTRYFFDSILFTMKDGDKWILTTEFENTIIEKIENQIEQIDKNPSKTIHISCAPEIHSRYKMCFINIGKVYYCTRKDNGKSVKVMLIFENKNNYIADFKKIEKLISIILKNEIFN